MASRSPSASPSTSNGSRPSGRGSPSSLTATRSCFSSPPRSGASSPSGGDSPASPTHTRCPSSPSRSSGSSSSASASTSPPRSPRTLPAALTSGISTSQRLGTSNGSRKLDSDASRPLPKSGPLVPTATHTFERPTSKRSERRKGSWKVNIDLPSTVTAPSGSRPRSPPMLPKGTALGSETSTSQDHERRLVSLKSNIDQPPIAAATSESLPRLRPLKSTARTLASERSSELPRPSREKMPVFVIYDYTMMNHRLKFVHDDEKSIRIKEIIEKFDQEGLLSRCEVSSAANPAPEEDISAVHSSQYIQSVQSLSSSRGKILKKYREFFGSDILTGIQTPHAASLAAGAVIAACNQVASGSSESAFAIVRPPGIMPIHQKVMDFAFSTTL